MIMQIIELLLHPSTASFAVGMLAGSYVTIILVYRRRKSPSMRSGE